MGNDNIDVGNRTSTRKRAQPAVDAASGRDAAPEKQIESPIKVKRFSGAMSQQGDEFRGNFSSPQKFVQLVGYREPKVLDDSQVSRYSNSAKR